MKNLSLLFLLFLIGCSKENEVDFALSETQMANIAYFKEVALGFEFGTAAKITRKWQGKLKVFVGGEKSEELLTELNKIKNEINTLATDGFSIEIVKDSSLSNYYVFLGTGNDFAKKFPSQQPYIASNYGLFSVNWASSNFLNWGIMYVDIFREKNAAFRKHLLREEFTQSLGLAKDSERYPLSIFQSAYTNVNEYQDIDRELIRLLYHPKMSPGLDSQNAEQRIIEIYANENR